MSEFMFGVSRQKPTRRIAKQLEKIAARHDAYLVEANLPGTGYQRWVAARNAGDPFNSNRSKAVHADLVAAGIVVPTDNGYELAKHARAK
jgi:hypothetical protein